MHQRYLYLRPGFSPVTLAWTVRSLPFVALALNRFGARFRSQPPKPPRALTWTSAVPALLARAQRIAELALTSPEATPNLKPFGAAPAAGAKASSPSAQRIGVNTAKRNLPEDTPPCYPRLARSPSGSRARGAPPAARERPRAPRRAGERARRQAAASARRRPPRAQSAKRTGRVAPIASASATTVGSPEMKPRPA